MSFLQGGKLQGLQEATTGAQVVGSGIERGCWPCGWATFVTCEPFYYTLLNLLTDTGSWLCIDDDMCPVVDRGMYGVISLH